MTQLQTRPLNLFWIALLLWWIPDAVCQELTKPQEKEQQRSNQIAPLETTKPDKTAEQNVDEPDSSLADIEQFEIRVIGTKPGTARGDSQALNEIINPFNARKRGRFYGSVYEYHRNDNFDARNFFDPVGVNLPEYKRNQFGGSFGSFITKRATVFGTYDGLRINKGSTLLSHVPTTAMKTGDFGSLDLLLEDPLTGSPFPGNVLPQERIHPSSAKLLSRIPDPNRDDPDRNYVNNQPYVQDQNTVRARVDYEMNDQSKVYADYFISDSRENRVGSLPSFGTNLNRRNQAVELDYSRNLGSAILTSLNLRFSRDADQEYSDDAGKAGLLASLGIEGVSTLDDSDEGVPDVYLGGYATLGLERGSSPRTFFRNQELMRGNLTWIRKKHKFNFGARLGWMQVNNHRTGGKRRGEFSFYGDFSGDAFADFLLGFPSLAVRGVGSDRQDLRQRSWRTFAQDDWKISSRFTLSAAIAYNSSPLAWSTQDNVSLFYPLLFNPPLNGEIVTTGSERASAVGLAGLASGHAVYPDRNDWEPMVGLAYSPFGNQKLLIRSSYQLRYNPIDLYRAMDSVGKNYPYYYTQRAESTSGIPQIELSQPFDSITPTELAIRAIDPHARDAYVQQWQMSIQNEIFRNWNLEFSYEGRRVIHSMRSIPANIPMPGEGSIQPRRPNPGFGRFDIAESGASSTSNGLELGARKRFSQAFSLDAEFRWERVFSDEIGDPSNPRNLNAERSLVGWMPERQLNVNYILDLPVGDGKALSTAWAGKLQWLLEDWRISGTTRVAQGRRFNPRLSGDTNNDGLAGERPDRLADGGLSPGERSIDRWFAVEAFAAPTGYQFGNSGRNNLISPGECIWDVGFTKRAKITDSGHAIEFRAQLFNALNHSNFDRPDATLGTDVFGKIFSAKNSREIELALKYSF